MECPHCGSLMTVSLGSPISPYLKTYHCAECSSIAIGCGDTQCDGYLIPEETNNPGVMRYGCVKCSWTGTGPRLPARLRVITTRTPAAS